MMMSKYYRIGVSALLLVAGHAYPLLGAEDPSRAFARSVVKEQQFDRFNYWNGTDGQPDGGMVIRFRFDATGDGKDDWLYKSSISPDNSWTLFVAEEDGFRKADGKVVSSVKPHVKDEGEMRILTTIYTRADFLSVVRSKVSEIGVVEIERIQPVEGYETVHEITSAVGWPENAYGPMQEFREGEMTSLQNIVLSDSPRWEELPKDTSLRSLHEQLEAGVKAELFGRKFTPKEASEVIALKERSQIESHEADSRKGATNSPNTTQSHEMSDIANTENRSLRWSFIAGVIAILGVTIILIRVLLRDRAS